MEFVLSAPSKTFLLGEYAALQGYPALLLNSEPRFELHIIKQSQFKLEGIDTHSPADRFIMANLATFNSYQLKFIDPYQQQGGLGASSAQFLLVYSFYKLAQRLNETTQPTRLKLDSTRSAQFYLELLKHYQNYAWAGKGIPPSGADIIGQLYGKLTWYHKTQQIIQPFTWPFQDLSLVLIRTGHKLATHQHLAGLNQVPAQKFSPVLEQAYLGLSQANASLFLTAVNDYAKILVEQGLTSSFTQTLLTKLKTLPYVKAAKGCGALGADIVLTIVNTEFVTDLQNWLTQQALVHYVVEVSEGLRLD